MAQFIKIAKISDLPNGEMKMFSIKGKEITLAKIDGEYLAFDDQCTHARCSLSGGYLEGHAVTCYCHGAQFDVTNGKVLAPPATQPLHVYKVKVDNGDILIEI